MTRTIEEHVASRWVQFEDAEKPKGPPYGSCRACGPRKDHLQGTDCCDGVMWAYWDGIIAVDEEGRVGLGDTGPHTVKGRGGL